MVRFNFYSKTNIAKLNAQCPFCLVPRHVIGTQKSYFVVDLEILTQYAAFGENITPFLTLLLVCPSCLEVYHNLLYDLPPQKNNRRMRLPVWRFGWGRNTAQERYGTVLHRASTCGDDCWIEHGIQVVCRSIKYERGGRGRSYRYRLVWSKTENNSSYRYRLVWSKKTDNNSTVGKKTFKFGRNCSWWWRKAPLLCQFPVFPAICHCTP